MEKVSVVIRFVKEGNVPESFVGQPSTYKFDAHAMTSVILACVNSCNIDPKKRCCSSMMMVQLWREDYGAKKKIQEN